MSPLAASQDTDRSASHFEAQALDHKGDAARWMVATVLVYLIMALYLFAALVWPFPLVTQAAPLPEPVTSAISRLFGLAMLVVAARWCDRNFLAHRHNYVVNRFRSNLLRSVDAASVDANRDVSRAVFRAAFRPLPSGYEKTGWRPKGPRSRTTQNV